jgi:nitrogen fixation protein FixH
MIYNIFDKTTESGYECHSLHVGLHYPTVEGNHNSVTVSLESVRAASDIRVSFSMQRNQWIIEMQADDSDEWQEVSAVDAYID